MESLIMRLEAEIIGRKKGHENFLQFMKDTQPEKMDWQTVKDVKAKLEVLTELAKIIEDEK